MELRTNLKKIGTSNHILIPSSIIKVYNLLSYTDDYEYAISVEKEGKRIVLNRVKKKSEEKQETLDTYKKEDDTNEES